MKFLALTVTHELGPGAKALFNQLLARLESLMTSIDDMKATLQAKIDKLTADVAAESTVEQSAVALLQGLSASVGSLKQQLADAIAAGGDASVLQPIADAADALASSIESNTASLSAAVTANTPAA
jgi:hypothetical protein